jgi:hypothetical protein
VYQSAKAKTLSRMEVSAASAESFVMGLESISPEGLKKETAGVTVKVYCVTPLQHLELCSADRRRRSGGTACATGLRVYDGAAILGEFFLSSFFLFSPIGMYLQSGTGNRLLIELGCGCGLSALCAAAALNASGAASGSLELIATDASPSCLALLQKSASEMGLRDGSSREEEELKNPSLIFSTGILDWGTPAAFFEAFPHALPSEMGDSGCDIVFGSDLVYFHSSVASLFGVAAALLKSSSDDRPPPLVFLSHYCRIPHGSQAILQAAENAGLVLFALPLTAFLMPSAVLPRGRGDMQFLVACRAADRSRTLQLGELGAALQEPFPLDAGTEKEVPIVGVDL